MRTWPGRFIGCTPGPAWAACSSCSCQGLSWRCLSWQPLCSTGLRAEASPAMHQISLHQVKLKTIPADIQSRPAQLAPLGLGVVQSNQGWHVLGCIS